jgi:hypothetical protein
MLKNILARDGSLKEQAKKLGQSAKADGTLKNYSGMVSKFQRFCEKSNYDFEHFTEQAVVHFILELEKSEPSYGIFAQIKPALVLLEKARGRPISAITATADMYLEAAKRRAAKRRQPAKKAGQIPADTIERLVEGHLTKVWAGEEKPDWLKLRTILRVTVVKYTFCRFDCYNRLKAGDFEDTGDGIRVTFNSAKNDQLHQGNCSFIVNELAVKVVRYAFQQFGFRMGDRGDDRFVNCVLRKTKGGWQVDGSRRLSYSTATEKLRELMRETGMDDTGVTDKSFKSLGVTGTLEAGADTEDVMYQGRWKSTAMPLRYKINSDQFKKDIAKKVV